MELVSYSRTRLQRHRFMRHFVYSVRYTAMPINESLLTITLYSLVITALVYNDRTYSVLSWRYNRGRLYFKNLCISIFICVRVITTTIKSNEKQDRVQIYGQQVKVATTFSARICEVLRSNLGTAPAIATQTILIFLSSSRRMPGPCKLADR